MADLNVVFQLRMVVVRNAANTPQIDSTSEAARDLVVARNNVATLIDSNQALRDRP